MMNTQTYGNLEPRVCARRRTGELVVQSPRDSGRKRAALAQAAAHQQLVEEQRTYHAAVKDFHEECQKNELLTARLAAVQCAV